jgi:hypothetical protein
MKTLLTAAMLLDGTSAFGASSASTYCQPIQINPTAGLANVYVSQNVALDGAAPFAVATDRDGDDGKPAVAGLRVELLKSALFEETTRTNCGWGCLRSDTKTFTAKFAVKADETIGFEIRGDVGAKVKELVAYTICHEVESSPVHN